MLVAYCKSSYGGAYIPNLDVVEIVFEGTENGSPIRRVMADIYALRASVDQLEPFGKSGWPRGFYKVLVFSMVVKRGRNSVDATRTGVISTYMEKVEPELKS